MAITYRGAGSLVSRLGAGGSGGWNASTVIGDLGILLVQTSNESPSLDVANGFVAIGSASVGTGTPATAGSVMLTAYYKFATLGGGIDTYPDLADSGDHTTSILLSFNTDLSTRPPTLAAALAYGSSSTAAAPAGTTLSNNATVLACIAHAIDSGGAKFSGWTNADISLTDDYDNSGNTGTGGGIGVAQGNFAVAGAFAATSATLTAASAQASLTLIIPTEDDVVVDTETDTLTHLQTDPGLSYVWVAAIEGFEYLLTNGEPAAVQTAWAATDWTTTPLRGLIYHGEYAQDIDPWRDEVQVPIVKFGVVPDDNAAGDLFGTTVMRTASANPATTETYLVESTANNSVTIRAQSTSAFASSGTIYIGTERISYTGTISNANASYFTGCTRGLFSPFAAANATGNKFGRNHRVSILSGTTQVYPVISTTCRTWSGKTVGIWMHRKIGGSSETLCTKANAQLVFAGVIRDISDTSSGMTMVECDDVRAMIRDCILMPEQLVAKAEEGFYLIPGREFNCRDIAQGVGTRDADPLVVATNATGNYQIEAGYIGAEELCTKINAWLAAAKVNGDLYAGHSISIVNIDDETTQGPRTVFRVLFESGGGISSTTSVASVLTLGSHACNFLGLSTQGSGAPGEPPGPVSFGVGGLGTETLKATGEVAPYRVMIGQQVDPDSRDVIIKTTERLGVFINQVDDLPAALKPATQVDGADPVGSWGVLDLAGNRAVAKHLGNGIFQLKWTDVLNVGFARNSNIKTGIRIDEPGDIVIKQVVMLEGGLADIVTRLFTSTGTSGYNSSRFDTYDQQLGAAIPHELLGDVFVKSIRALDEGNAGSSFVLLDRPTKLSEVIAPDFALRLAIIVWKDQGLRAAAWQTTSALMSIHTFTEANKASGMDRDAQRSPSSVTEQYLRNVVKINYNRRDDGAYASTINLVDVASIGDLGSRKAITIDAANAVDSSVAMGQNVEHLAENILTRLPLLARPLWFITRTISPAFYEDVAPGDLCTVTDNFTRNPATGARGLSGQPGIVFSVKRRFGGFDEHGASTPPFGEVTICLAGEDRTAAYSPCAEVDSTAASGGYVAGTKTLTFQAHRHSETSEAVDASHFAASDAVTVVEIDPAASSAPLSWDDTIVSVSGSTCVLSAGLSGWDSAKKYRMISRAYGSAQSTQKADTYQADDSDGLIADVAKPYRYSYVGGSTIDYDYVQPTELPRRHAAIAYGDGRPLDTGYERDMISMVNQLVHVKTAVCSPRLYSEAMATPTTGSGWYLLEERQLHLGRMRYPETQAHTAGSTTAVARLIRNLRVAPFARCVQSGATRRIRVRFCTRRAAGDSNHNVTFSGSFTEAIFVASSSSWTTLTEQYINIAPHAVGASAVAYLVIEGETDVEYRGLAKCQLGPLTILDT